MCKKANELIRRQQIHTQMSCCLSGKDLLKVVWDVRSFHDKHHFGDILLLEATINCFESIPFQTESKNHTIQRLQELY